MPFVPAIFEAEVALKLIPTEHLPSVAQDALEAGYDGPHVLRMAILESTDGWAIDQALPPMLAELGCGLIAPENAALRLAVQRARRILESDEDPLASLPYFSRLLRMASYPRALFEVGYLEDDCDFFTADNAEERRARAREALENLLSPELSEQRRAERRAVWEREQARIRSEWPYVVNSPSGRVLLKQRYIDKITEMRPIVWIELVAWILVGWAFSSWRTTVVGFVVTMPILFALPIWGEYRRMKWERRDTLLRRGVPEDQI